MYTITHVVCLHASRRLFIVAFIKAGITGTVELCRAFQKTLRKTAHQCSSQINFLMGHQLVSTCIMHASGTTDFIDCNVYKLHELQYFLYSRHTVPFLDARTNNISRPLIDYMLTKFVRSSGEYDIVCFHNGFG